MQGARLYQQVAKKLASAIAAGDYPPGTRLPAERKLAERFEVSRPTVREAIIALELAGCVEVKGGSGVYVVGAEAGAPPSAAPEMDPFEILQARIMFEAEVAALAARQMSDGEIVGLEQMLQEMAEGGADGTKAEVADEKFYLSISRGTHNRALVSLCGHLWQLRNSASSSAHIVEKVRQSGFTARIEMYREILSAIKRRDPEAARNAMRDHLQRLAQQLLDATEAEALETARRQVREARERFALP